MQFFQTPHEINRITGYHIRRLQSFKHTPVASLKHFDQISDILARSFTLLLEICADSEPMQIKSVKIEGGLQILNNKLNFLNL